MKVKVTNKEINEIIKEEVRKIIISENKYESFQIKDGDEIIENCDTIDEANTKISDLKKQFPTKTLEVEKKIYDSYEHMLDELDGMCEQIQEQNGKRVLRLTKPQMMSLINRMVNEVKTPGIDTYKKVHGESGTINKENKTKVNKKIDDSLKMDKPTEKVVNHTTEKENEYIEDFRGGTLLDLDYGNEPSDKFNDRVKKSLEGDSTMGNSSDAANVVKTDLGKNIQKIAKRKKKVKSEMPMYSKEPQPVKIVNESVEKDKEKMFNLISFKKR